MSGGAVTLNPIAIDARKARDFGIGTYIRELVSALTREPRAVRHRFLLFVRAEDEELFGDLPENFRRVRENAPGYSLSELTLFPLHVRKLRPQLFHATHYVLPPLLGAPAVVTIHDVIHLLYPQFLPNRLARHYARAMIGRSLSKARKIIAVSETTRRDLLAQFSVPPSKIEVISNGVSAKFRPDVPAEEIARVRAAHKLPDSYALFVGGEKPHKNVATVIRAFAAALPAVPRLSLVLAGPMPHGKPDLERTLSSSVRVIGAVPQEELPALYAGALFLLHPALYEGFGLPVVEAMASGTPVLASTAPALQEVAGGAALLADPLDADSLAKEIKELAQDESLRRRCRNLGLARAREFSWESAAARTLAVYEEALET
jgi:alpha-1,3-rhamnosyl/mannosyltransferase